MATLAEIDRMVRADLRRGNIDPRGAVVRWCADEDRLHAQSRRNHASVDTASMDFAFARVAGQLDAEHLRALVAHEVGHVLAMHYWNDGSEDGADRAAQEFLSVPICYDRSYPGKGLQQVCAMPRRSNVTLCTPCGLVEFDDETGVGTPVENPELKLWKYNRRTGIWDLQRDVTAETATPWLARFEADEPNERFVLAERRPVTEVEKELRKQARSRKKKATNPAEPSDLRHRAMAERLARGL